MGASRRSARPHTVGTFDGDAAVVRPVAPMVVAAWDGWVAGPDYRAVLADPIRDGIEALRAAPADPDRGRFAAAVTALLGGVPPPTAAPGVRRTVERLRPAAFPPRSGGAAHRPPFG